ncbi:endonuclease/exonuclease/phosphatase family protein [Sulfurimonas lithotrophica]|uniref:endonuclease/exonuclease/phosphatase family protein n=1 Tax=Sulfurimonas lithotrophica TaxID=2590022 RepID=UPI001F5223CC|nr:endonuclease/exonuclease/phosphatase family protein [Sulfurimonas lithotrophica]
MKIATYNVEALFDLEKKGYKYKEYKPNSKSLWNKKNYNIKLNNISKVIKDIDADIIALQEVHSLQALKDLRLKLKQNGLYYKYFTIADKKDSAIKVALLSKIPFVYAKEINVTSTYKYRNILEVKFKVENQEFYLFNNHWKSKSGPESMRMVSAKALRDRIEKIGYDKNIILLGDFNSHYEENKLFIKNRKHNDTNGKTGINDILRTKYQIKNAKNTKYKKNSFYNLWYDTNLEERYSYIFKGEKEALDNILVSQSLLNNKGMSYKDNSIKNFSKDYLMYKGKYPYRWQVSKARVPKHKGKGYSDHLAVIATFIFN